MTEVDRSVQLAQLWSALRGVQLQIEDQILPLASQLGLEDRALTIALGEVSKRIGAHFETFRLQAVPNKEPQR